MADPSYQLLETELLNELMEQSAKKKLLLRNKPLSFVPSIGQYDIAVKEKLQFKRTQQASFGLQNAHKRNSTVSEMQIWQDQNKEILKRVKLQDRVLKNYLLQKQKQ